MKSTEQVFSQPKALFEVYRNIIQYSKAEKSAEDRKRKLAWKPIKSTNGFVVDDKLFLPENILQQSNFTESATIIMLNENSCSNKMVHLINDELLLYRKCPKIELDIFELKLNEKIELHLLYNQFAIGLPERDSFKLCDIKMNQPIEIKINGKLDFSLTSRRERTYIEQQYIIQYFGVFNSCEIYKPNSSISDKQFPSNLKSIDLNKVLW